MRLLLSYRTIHCLHLHLKTAFHTLFSYSFMMHAFSFKLSINGTSSCTCSLNCYGNVKDTDKITNTSMKKIVFSFQSHFNIVIQNSIQNVHYTTKIFSHWEIFILRHYWEVNIYLWRNPNQFICLLYVQGLFFHVQSYFSSEHHFLIWL